MNYEIKELRKFINRVCTKNICRATKEMALSQLACIKTEFEKQTKEIEELRKHPESI